MTSPTAPPAPTAPRPRRQIVGGLVVAAASAASWFAWMGWDTTYQTDPVTGISSGPYEAWQVVCCGLTLLAALVTAVLLGVRPMVAALSLSAAFAVAWTTTAAARDETGLFLVGLLMLVAGLTPVAVAVCALVLAVQRRRGRDVQTVIAPR